MLDSSKSSQIGLKEYITEDIEMNGDNKFTQDEDLNNSQE